MMAMKIIQGGKQGQSSQLIVIAIERTKCRRELWNTSQSIERTSQMLQSLRKRREFGQSQHTEIEFSIDTIANAFESDVHRGCSVPSVQH
jgi:hypothetical protein